MLMKKRHVEILLWVLFAIIFIYRVAFSLAPRLLPGPAVVLSVLPFAFALVHGALNYRLRDMLVFLALTLVVSNLIENIGILTGFPFGSYDYTDQLGPKIFLVPVLIGVAYFGMGYLSWMLARLIIGNISPAPTGHMTYTVPLLAGFLMVSWNLTFDPVASTVTHSWTWLQGGAYYGVPFSNFAGWFLTVYIFYQLFALYLKNRSAVYESLKVENSQGYWWQAALSYGTIGLAAILLALFPPADSIATDAAGRVWHSQDVFGACGLVALFTMIPFTFVSMIKIAELFRRR
jgi:uncharacterized membrane protein